MICPISIPSMGSAGLHVDHAGQDGGVGFVLAFSRQRGENEIGLTKIPFIVIRASNSLHRAFQIRVRYDFSALGPALCLGIFSHENPRSVPALLVCLGILGIEPIS